MVQDIPLFRIFPGSESSFNLEYSLVQDSSVVQKDVVCNSERWTRNKHDPERGCAEEKTRIRRNVSGRMTEGRSTLSWTSAPDYLTSVAGGCAPCEAYGT